MDSPKPKTLTFQDTPTDKTDDEPPPEREHFHIQKYVPEEKPPVPMLDPDNPLLEKFQKALKQHLLEQIEILSGEVFELETAAKKKDEARESIGVEAYEAQQLVVQQQAELDVCVTKLKDITAAREEVEAQLDDLTKVHRETTNKLLEAEREEMDLQNEIESTNLLTHQMKQWEDYVESELMVNQRMSEKTRKDKIKLAEEKRAQDMHVYRLMTEIWKLESELETLDMQLRVKEDEREKFAEAVAQCNTDIEAFETEYRCLLHSWNSVVVAVGIRDKHYNQMKTELDTLHEKVVNMGTIIQQVKKECNKELERNEVLTSVKHRIDGEIKSYTVQLEERNQNRGLLEREMYDMQLVVDRLNKDIEEIAGENNHKRSTFTAIMREFETLNSQKYKMEEENLVNLQNQLADAKAARHLSAQLKAHKETIKNLEITLANSENANSKTNMEMESQKRLNHDLEELLNELVKDRDSLQEQVDRYTKELKRCQIIVDKKQTSLDGIAKKIEKLMERSSGVVISPQELKIKALEKGIEEIQDKNKELQKFWLREQGHIVSLSEQRQEQIHQINLMRKQIMILEQKNLKISDEIDALEQEEERMSKNINRLHNEILSLNELLFKKRGSKTEMDKLHDIVQHAYTNKLKDCEIECLELEAMISELEEDKQNLSNKLIDLNREALAWEKKLKMAVEMKQNINEERKATGEIGNMKAEIHRMNVRYTQLRKAQEKLIHDLEHCISRRDAIFRTSLAREKKSTSDADHSRILYTRKLNDMRNKVKQIENEVAVLNEQLENARKTRDEIKASIANAQEDITGYEEQKKCLLQELDNLMTQRQMKVEIIELKQRQAMLYSELLKGHKPYIMYRSESALFSTFDKHNQLNLKLIETVQGLLIEFPRYENILRRMFNTLTAYSVVMEE